MQEPQEMIRDTQPMEPMAALLAETRRSNELLAKQLRSTRGLALFLAMLILALLLGGLFVGVTLQKTLGQVDFAQISENLEQLDVQALNQAIQSLERQVKQLDIATLNEALEQIGGAAQGIEEALGAFSRFGEGLGSIFGH